MSTHPNAILLLALKPDDLARKTYRAILEESGVADDRDITINRWSYHHEVMETEYDEDWQIHADEGDIIIFSFITYGYGESVSWSDLAIRKTELEAWAIGVCERHHCSYEIRVTAGRKGLTMSGGSYDYAYGRISDLADEIRGCCSAASPALRQAFKNHLMLVAGACHAIEWNDSCDGDDHETELIRRCLGDGVEIEAATEQVENAAKALLDAIAAGKETT